jgi:hypothetical protein
LGEGTLEHHKKDTALAEGFVYDAADHLEEHPSGKQHVFLSAASVFSFDASRKHLKTMNSIHHPNGARPPARRPHRPPPPRDPPLPPPPGAVANWYYSLQRGMNRLFTTMEPGVAWYSSPTHLFYPS